MAVNRIIVIVGCGPGARECLTAEALSAIEDAEVLVGSARLLSLFANLNTERVAVRGYREETILAIQQHRGRRIAVLVTGDPGLASLASAVIEHFGFSFWSRAAGHQFRADRLCEDWPQLEDARIISVHAVQPNLDFNALAAERKIAILTGNTESMRWIALLAHRLGNEWRIVVAED